MQSQAAYAVFPLIDAGADWLTCTSKASGVSNALEDLGMDELRKEKATGGRVTVARRLGYAGLQGDGLFVGRRDHDAVVILSGPRCTPLAREFIPLASNVSRFDLQATVWTEGEACHLAEWTYRKMVELAPKVGRPPALLFLQGYPSGETLTVGSRRSDSYGRLYDKTAQARQGEPRLVWRYEVEWKRREAKRQAIGYSQAAAGHEYASTQVGAWYKKRGVAPSYIASSDHLIAGLQLTGPDRSPLTWLRDSVSITVRRVIAQEGAGPVIEALGLTKYLREGTDNGNLATTANGNAPHLCADPSRADNTERVLLH